MDLITFENKRLDLFKQYGFQGESQRITNNSGQETYMIIGGEGAIPTILLHGGISEASEFFSLANQINGKVVIPDRPGCGLTYPVDYFNSDFRETATSWYLDLIKSLGVDKVNIVANSMGGYFSTVFALAHPERVNRLIFVGAPAGFHKHIPLFLRLWGNRFFGQIINRLPSMDVEGVRKNVFKSMLVSMPEDLPIEFLEVALTAMSIPGAQKTSYSMLRKVLNLRGWRKNMSIREEAKGLSIPILFLWGEKDKFEPPSNGKDMITRMPNAKIEIISNAGHLPYLDQPNLIEKAVNAFLGN